MDKAIEDYILDVLIDARDSVVLPSTWAPMTTQEVHRAIRARGADVVFAETLRTLFVLRDAGKVKVRIRGSGASAWTVD